MSQVILNTPNPVLLVPGSVPTSVAASQTTCRLAVVGHMSTNAKAHQWQAVTLTNVLVPHVNRTAPPLPGELGRTFNACPISATHATPVAAGLTAKR